MSLPVRLQDSVGAAAGAIHDTLTQAPLPGGAAAVFRFLFQVPQWLQIGGALLALLVAALALRVAWHRRAALGAWFRSRSRQTLASLGLLVVVAVAAASLLGLKTWNYMQHDNGFCTGCHIMERPFRRFAAGAGRHEELKCHDCHQQSIWASTRQMYLWVAERPEKIGVHAPVPNLRCRGCHEQRGTERWQHVMRLAGHKVHFESDSSALAGLACVKCHGAEVHKFVPSTSACTQSGCHEQQRVRLAAMARLPEIKCVTCHAFTTQLPGLASRDSAVRALSPRREQCLTCHQMRGRLPASDSTRDPHRGACGLCHDVHADLRPADAGKRCATCHADRPRSAFHEGAAHRGVRDNCLTCHQPHQASVDAANCVGCHTEVRRRGLTRPPLPFDTNVVIRRRPPAAAPPEEEQTAHRGKGDELPAEPPPKARAFAAVSPPADSFPHRRHASLPCLTCHVPASRGSRLTFEAPRGCDLCHHQRVIAGSVSAQDCARCHSSAELARPRPATVTVRIGTRAPAPRPVGFEHPRHARIACADCHRPPLVTPPDSVASCRACHDQHHTEPRNCSLCHNRAEAKAAHPRASHTRCDACHTASRIAALVPVRSFCLTCHAPQAQHQAGKECTPCHFLETPARFQRRLTGRTPG